MKGSIVEQGVEIIKDDGCNTNVISLDFANKHRDKLNVRKCELSLCHSAKSTEEEIIEIVWDTKLNLGETEYRSNWAIANIRYDILLGMPWNEHSKPVINYRTKQVKVENKMLPNSDPANIISGIEIGNIGVRKFPSIIRKGKGNAEVYMVHNITSTVRDTQNELKQKHHELAQVLEKYKSVIVDELPDGLPPKREVDHEIVEKENSSPPYRPTFQLSTAELVATKEYITKLIKSGKLRPSKSPYGSPLFFVRQKGQIRGAMDYRAMNIITKKCSNT